MQFIILGLISGFVVFIVNNCMMTNIPDTITIMHESESVVAYGIETKFRMYQFIPEQALYITFERSPVWPNDNSDRLYIRGNLFVEDPFSTLEIREISYNYNKNNYKLIENEYFDLSKDRHFSTDNFLVDENDEFIVIDGKTLHVIWLNFGRLQDKILLDFKPKYLGQEKEIELIQIYSINGTDYREEKYKYKVICGGKKFDITRPVKSLLYYIFPP